LSHGSPCFDGILRVVQWRPRQAEEGRQGGEDGAGSVGLPDVLGRTQHPPRWFLKAAASSLASLDDKPGTRDLEGFAAPDFGDDTWLGKNGRCASEFAGQATLQASAQEFAVQSGPQSLCAANSAGHADAQASQVTAALTGRALHHTSDKAMECIEEGRKCEELDGEDVLDTTPAPALQQSAVLGHFQSSGDASVGNVGIVKPLAMQGPQGLSQVPMPCGTMYYHRVPPVVYPGARCVSFLAAPCASAAAPGIVSLSRNLYIVPCAAPPLAIMAPPPPHAGRVARAIVVRS